MSDMKYGNQETCDFSEKLRNRKDFVLSMEDTRIQSNLVCVLDKFESLIYSRFREGDISKEQREYSAGMILECLAFLEKMIVNTKKKLQDDTC